MCGVFSGFMALGVHSGKTTSQSISSSAMVRVPTSSKSAQAQKDKEEFLNEASSEIANVEAWEGPALSEKASFHERVIWGSLTEERLKLIADRSFFGEGYEKRRTSYSLSEYKRTAKNWKFAATEPFDLRLPDQTILNVQFTFNQEECVNSVAERLKRNSAFCFSARVMAIIDGYTSGLSADLERSILGHDGYYYSAVTIYNSNGNDYKFGGTRFFLPLPKSEGEDVQKLKAKVYLDPTGEEQLTVEIIWHKLDQSLDPEGRM